MLEKALHSILSAWRGTYNAIIYCFEMSWRASKLFTLSRLIIECVAPMVPIFIAYLGKLLIDTLVSGDAIDIAMKNTIQILVIMLLVMIIKVLLNNWKQYAAYYHSELIQKDLIHNQMEHAMNMDLAFFDQPECHDKLVSSFSDSTAVSEEIWYALGLLSAILTLSGTFLLAIRINLLYSLVLLFVAVPSTFVSLVYTRKLYQLNLEQINEGRKSSLFHHLSSDRFYAQDLRLFDAKNYILDKHSSIWNKLFIEKKNLISKRSLYLTILEILPIIAIGVISMHIAIKVLNDMNSIGDYTFYTGMLHQMWDGIIGIGASVMALHENRLKFENLQSFLSYENKVKGGIQMLDKEIEEIKFDNVSFRYSATDPLVLDRVSFCVRKKETIALVGLNGSGKSTLIKLLLRMYDPTEGKITINGIDIKSYTLESLRSQFSVYFQNMQSFPLSIRENFIITDRHDKNEFGGGINKKYRDESLDTRVKKAMQDASCFDILGKARDGFEHNITRVFDSNGIELSIGQYQKFALARVFFRSHQVLVLDEPTSSVDAASEQKILDWLQKESKEHIVIWVSHNFTNIHMANRIMLLEKGRLIEEGTHNELILKNGKYACLYRYQEEKLLKNS